MRSTYTCIWLRALLVEAMPDERAYDTTVRAFIRTRNKQARTTFNVLVDKASKLGHNDHAVPPDSKDAVKLNLSSRAVPFSRIENRAYTIPE